MILLNPFIHRHSIQPFTETGYSKQWGCAHLPIFPIGGCGLCMSFVLGGGTWGDWQVSQGYGRHPYDLPPVSQSEHPGESVLVLERTFIVKEAERNLANGIRRKI